MSFTSIVKVLPEALRHPAGLAMVGSFAFHGFLFAGGIPLIPGDSDAIDSRRLVSLVKLSPAEQGRLPQAASSQIAPLPQPPPDLSSFVLPPMAKLPDVAPPPELFDLPSPGTSTPNLPSSTLGSIPSLGSASPIRVSPGRPLPFISPSQIPSQPAGDSSPFSPPNSNTPASPSPSLPPPSLDEIMSGIKPGEVDDFGSSSPPSDQQIDPSVKDVFKDQPSSDQPAPEAPGTSKDLDSMNQSLARAREISGDPGLAARNINIPALYPKAACQDRPEGSAIVWATVRPNGELAEAPTLQGTSGSKILDDAALEAVKRYQFPPSSKYQAFLPTLWFEYSEEACADEDTASPSPSESPATNNQSSSNKSSGNLSQQLATRPAVGVNHTYPKAACEDQLEGQPLVEAKVNPDGELADEPVIIKSTGHSILDNAAIGDMKNGQFKADSQPYKSVFSPRYEYSEAVCSKTRESQSSDDDSEKTTPKSSQKNSGSSKSSTSSKDSDSSSPSKKSSQPTFKSSPKSSEGAASEDSKASEEEATSEKSPEATEEPTSQESPDSEETSPSP